VKVRQNGRIVSVAVIVAVGVNSDGRREMLGMDIGPSEAETFWTAFLRRLRAGACGALSRVHFMRNALAHAGRNGRRVVSAFIATAFAQDDAETAEAQWRRVADQLRPNCRSSRASSMRPTPTYSHSRASQRCDKQDAQSAAGSSTRMKIKRR
jgi:putative transposase